jgi:hypothetical protein
MAKKYIVTLFVFLTSPIDKPPSLPGILLKRKLPVSTELEAWWILWARVVCLTLQESNRPSNSSEEQLVMS